jgi:sulfur carrier protein ThiS
LRGKTMRNLHEKSLQFMSLTLIVSLSLIAFSFLPQVSAEMTISVLNPAAGPVGTVVSVTANVTTANGNYSVLFDGQVVVSGIASGQDVAVNFSVPQTYAGSHEVKVADLITSENATRSFIVTTNYDVRAIAEQKLQEGDQVPIVVNITGGEKSSTFAANITVTAPNSVTYANTTSFLISVLGTGLATVNFPRDFPNAASKFVGDYGLHLNGTLVNATFSIGLTNSSEYHRGDVVNIKAEYEQNEIVTVTVSGKNVNNAANLTADPTTGVVSYDWTVPQFADIGSYSVTVISTTGTTRKTPSDSQNFTVPGFAVNVTAKNLAGETVSGVVVEAYEFVTLADRQTTGTSGVAFLNLEIGDYTCHALVSGQNVGEVDVNVQNVTAVVVVCSLTNLRVQVVAVVNGSEIPMPEVGVLLNPANSRVATDINGTVVFHSLQPNASAPFVLNLTRFNSPFNVTSISNLLNDSTALAWFDVKVICPNYPLQITVTKTGGNPFDNAIVRVQEALGAPLYEEHTNTDGVALFNAPFGVYSVQVFDSDMTQLNQTTVTLFGNQNTSVTCSLYGLAVTVKVVDYFGQGIANVQVALKREGKLQKTINTGADGVALFDSMIGGQFDIAISPSGTSTPIAAQSASVDESHTTINIMIGEYVVFAGMLVQTSQLAAIILIILIVALALELYVRRRGKSHKAETESTDKES